MNRGRLTAAVVAGMIGYGLLALLYPRLSPVAAWRYSLTREAAIAAARTVAARAGEDVGGWTASYAVLATNDASGTYRRTRTVPAEIAPFLPPLHSHVIFSEPGGGRTLRIRFGTDERPIGLFRSPPSSAPAASPPAIDIARAALAALLDADTYARIVTQEPRTSSSDSGQHVTFSLPSPADPSDLTVTADVTVYNAVATQASIGPTFTEKFTSAQSSDLALRILSVPSIVVGVVAWPLAFTFVILSLMRREFHWRSTAGFVLLLILLSLVHVAAGSSEYARVRASTQPAASSGFTVSTDQGRTSQQVGQRVAQWFWFWNPMVLIFVPFWTGGYPLGRRAAPVAVVTARDFLIGRVSRRPVGHSIAAGVLFAGVLAAIPYVVAALRVSPYAALDPDDVRVFALGVRQPVLAAFAAMQDATLLILFAFVVPLIRVYVIRDGLARALVIGIVALWLMGDTPFTVSLTAAIVSGGLMTAAAYLIYTRYDLLTLLMAGAVGRVVIHALALQVQPSPDTSRAAIWVWFAVAALAGAGLAIAKWGRPVNLDAAAEEIAIGSAVVDRVDRERLRAEFDLARRVQEQMLPPIPAAVEGFALAASCRPAREVGGDLYDFIQIDHRRFLLAVADVSGKGVPAALFMTMTKGLIGAVAEQVTEPDRIAWSMNEHLYQTCARRIFVTLALGVLDTEARTFRYTRAGHNPPIWRRSARKETQLLRKGGVGLGLVGPRMFNPRTQTEKIDLEPSDALVLYSDGIVEAMNMAREEYGEERLIGVIEGGDHLDAASLRDAILADVQAFVGGAAAHDDMTLLIVRAS